MATTAHAATLTLNCTEYASSFNPSGCSTGATPTITTTPGIYSYSDTSLMSASSSGGIIPGSTYPTGYTGASFYDAFVFTVSSSLGNSISSTITLPPDFAISNFEERLYSYSSTAGTAPFVGAIPTAIDFWTSPTADSGTVAVLPATPLAAGTYVLEVRGDVTGTSGGGYTGDLQLTTVPLPAGLPLLVSGLGLMGGLLRRYKAS
jgi:hypothetical protein